MRSMCRTAWAAEWYSRNSLDGETRHLLGKVGTGVVALFRSRREAREWINLHYGYIRHRHDLRSEPHGWRVPRAVRVRIKVQR